jgi:adenylate kinase
LICVDSKTYETIQGIPIASNIGQHARQDLVRRLEDYQMHRTSAFQFCVSLILDKFIPTIERHAISGISAVRM